MMTRRALVVALLAACGDEPVRSGVARDTPVADLTSADVQQWCDWAIAEQGGFGHDNQCDDGTTITTDSVARCVDTLADLTCTDTIGELEDCIVETDGNPCLFPTEPACAAYEACFP